MSKLAHSHPLGIMVECHNCGRSFWEDEEPCYAAFQLTGDLLCPSCATEAIEENGPFGVGA